MTRPDLKKLITGFLTLSIVATSGIYLLSNFSITRSSSSALEDASGGQMNLVPENALETPAPPGSSNSTNAGGVLSALDPVNFTETVSSALFDEIVRANPDGVPENSPDAKLNNPDTERIKSAIANLVADAVPKFQLPTFETIVPEQKLNILAQFTGDDTTQYLAVVAKIYKNANENPPYANLGEDISPAALVPAQAELRNTVETLLALAVPQPLARMHRSFIAIFLNQHNIIAAARESSADPLKAFLFLSANQKTAERDIRIFTNEYNRIHFVTQTSFRPRSVFLGMINALVGTRTAHAQLGGIMSVPVTVAAVESRATITFYNSEVANTTAILAELQKEWSLTLQQDEIKKKMSDDLAKRTATAIKNDGDPLMVENYEVELGGAAAQGGNEALGKVNAAACPSIRLYIQNTLGAGIPPPSGATVQNDPTMKSSECLTAGYNMPAFYNNFSAGGWDAYFRTLLPAGNIYGALGEAQMAALAEAEIKSETMQSELEANQGFKSKKQCAPGKENGDGSCSEELIREPGQTIGEAFRRNITANQAEQIVNAHVIAPAEELWRQTITDVKGTINGIKNMFTGDTFGAFLTALVDSLMQKVEQRMNDELNNIAQKIGAFNINAYLGPYQQYLDAPNGLWGL